MPIKVPDNLPAKDVLDKENIFIMDESRAFHQDIRPLKIGLLNLMPLKEITEVQILRLLSNSPLQVDLTLLATATYSSKNTSARHLRSFYKNFDEIRQKKYDGFIITGAPVEKMNFEDVAYWEELTRIMEWTKNMVTSTLHICWGAQAALYYHYGVPKYDLKGKMFGVFEHKILNPTSKLTRGFDNSFFAPHSRHTETRAEDISGKKELELLSVSEEAGVYLAIGKNGRQVFVTGHSEYDPDTLKTEYERDLAKGLPIEIPKGYFRDDKPSNETVVRWRSHANLLFSNWINYYVYQETPYDLV